MSFSGDPNAVIPQAIAFALNALKSAYKEASVKRFVLTSSSSAAVLSVADSTAPGVDVTEDTWNETAIKAAWADPPYTQERGAVVYAASKTESEQAVWKYHKENRNRRPDLVVNTGEFWQLLRLCVSADIISSPQLQLRQVSGPNQSGIP